MTHKNCKKKLRFDEAISGLSGNQFSGNYRSKIPGQHNVAGGTLVELGNEARRCRDLRRPT